MAHQLADKIKSSGAVATVSRESNVRALLGKMKGEFAHVLPRHLSPERMARLALTVMRRTPKLFDCSDQSLAGAIMEAAQLGLDFSVPNEAFLVPYGRTCQFQIGYKGLSKMAKQSAILVGKPIADLYPMAVYSNETYDRQRGNKAFLRHNLVKFGQDQGDFLGVYAYCGYVDGGIIFDEMPKKAIDEHRDQYAKTGNFWRDHYEQMACKTVLRRLIWRYLDMTALQAEVLRRDIERETGADIPSGPIVDLAPSDFEVVVPADPDNLTDETPSQQPGFDADDSLKADVATQLNDLATVGKGKVAEQRRAQLLGVALQAHKDLTGNEVMQHYTVEQLTTALPVLAHLVEKLPEILKTAQSDDAIRDGLRQVRDRFLAG